MSRFPLLQNTLWNPILLWYFLLEYCFNLSLLLLEKKWGPHHIFKIYSTFLLLFFFLFGYRFHLFFCFCTLVLFQPLTIAGVRAISLSIDNFLFALHSTYWKRSSAFLFLLKTNLSCTWLRKLNFRTFYSMIRYDKKN